VSTTCGRQQGNHILRSGLDLHSSASCTTTRQALHSDRQHTQRMLTAGVVRLRLWCGQGIVRQHRWRYQNPQQQGHPGRVRVGVAAPGVGGRIRGHRTTTVAGVTPKDLRRQCCQPSKYRLRPALPGIRHGCIEVTGHCAACSTNVRCCHWQHRSRTLPMAGVGGH